MRRIKNETAPTSQPQRDVDNPFIDVLVVGAGAAGCFAAISCAELSRRPLSICVLEATNRPLTKVKISGGGRCNVTHKCFDPRELIKHYPRGGKSLINGFFAFGPTQMLDWLEANGVHVVAEQDGRMFPDTNQSQTIIDCFLAAMRIYDIALRKCEKVTAVTPIDGGFEVATQNDVWRTRQLIFATGSAPIGHTLLQGLGHTITPLAPSLFTLKSDDAVVTDLQGVSVEDVEIQLTAGKAKFRQRGPILFTHWGFSGPAILKLSAFAARELQASDYQGHLSVRWLPNASRERLLQQWALFRQEQPRKKMAGMKQEPLPKRLWLRLLELCGLEEQVWGQVSDKALTNLCDELLGGRYHFSGKGIFKEEFVTCGGVDLKEITLKSFESKKHPGLYIVGELLDVDGITGGFNFQNAWTSARLAATAIIKTL